MHRSLASIAGLQPSQEAAPDSENLSAALLGQAQFGRISLVEQASSRSLRQGPWKYIRPNKGPKRNELTNTELGNDPAPQLYDLASDPGETRNLASELAYRAEAMERALKAIEDRGGVDR
jgi:arylsulfatase A-like enzyme